MKRKRKHKKGNLREGRDTAETNEGNETIDFDEFVICLGLIGHIKYEEIEEMTLYMRVEGMIRNFLQEEDEHKVISKYCCPPLPRYDPSTAEAVEGQDLKTVILFWERMDLSHVFGFPTWEEPAFKLFAASFSELSSIFQQYAKSGAAGSGSATSALTMQKTELTNLALDCGLATKDFMMTRIHSLMEVSDQTDAKKVMHQRFKGRRGIR